MDLHLTSSTFGFVLEKCWFKSSSFWYFFLFQTSNFSGARQKWLEQRAIQNYIENSLKLPLIEVQESRQKILFYIFESDFSAQKCQNKQKM